MGKPKSYIRPSLTILPVISPSTCLIFLILTIAIAITSKSTAEVDFVGDDYETVDLEGDEDFEKIEMDEAEMADWEEI